MERCRKIVGWAMAEHLRADLPLTALWSGHIGAAAWRGPDPPF
jgi:hypothetical protein